MSAIAAVYIGFALLAIVAFRQIDVQHAIILTIFAGWILLPVCDYPSPVAPQILPFWIIGAALPSDILLTKAWVVPSVALLGALLMGPASLGRLRATKADMAIGGFCLWPLLVSLIRHDVAPSGPVASAYLTGTWGTMWLLGRIWLSTGVGARSLVFGAALAGLACLPIALVEGVSGPFLYRIIYAVHPFQNDGAARYLGYRPLGFFEHGNQYGIWVAVAALAWLLLLLNSAAPSRRLLRAGFAISLAIVLAAQSVGGILLFGVAVVLAVYSQTRVARLVPLVAAGTLALGVVVHLSGMVPLRALATATPVGQRIVQGFKDLGRGSLTWRISQDLKTLPTIRANALVGTNRWDWWRPSGTRPWGFLMLVLGQFGIVGLVLGLGPISFAAMTAWMRHSSAGDYTEPWTQALGLIILIGIGDAMLNSFLYLPIITMAGAIVSSRTMLDRSGGDQLVR